MSTHTQDTGACGLFLCLVRLDESNIILRGSEEEAPSAILKGTLVLCLSEPLQIRGIRMRFTGEKRLAYVMNRTVSFSMSATLTPQ